MDQDRIADMQAKALELRQMAAAATTEDVRDALLRLADRYAALADRLGRPEVSICS